MSNGETDTLPRLQTGIPGLDEVLGGGLPERSFNLIAGAPGSGKTTLAQQIMFANATRDRKAVYFTVLGEPPLKMLHYLRQMAYFDPAKIGDCIHFVDLSAEVLKHDLGKILDLMVATVEELEPAIVVIDSFRTMMRTRSEAAGQMQLQDFLQRLALHLTSWEATTFLVGEYSEHEMSDNPIFTIADAVCWLAQHRERSSIVRTLQIMKLRGQASMPGLHTFRIDRTGIRVFPRIRKRIERQSRGGKPERLTTGIRGMDELLGGGIPAGDRLLIAGPSGTGKTCFATHFVAADPDDRAVIVVFEELADDYLARASLLGFDLAKLVREGKLRVISLRPLDLSVDETLLEIEDAVREIGARRLVIDSLTGFEIALAPPFRADFKESLYRMLGVLTGAGVTVVMTIEVTEAWTELSFSPHQVSFLTENILILRYAEIEGRLRKVLAVVKMRRSEHDNGLFEIEITNHGMVIKERLAMYRGILSGEPKPVAPTRPVFPGLSDEETVVLEALMRLGEATEAALAATTPLHPARLGPVLGRLVGSNHVLKVTADGQVLYRPLARVLGERQQ